MVWKKHDYDDIPGTYVFDGHYAHDSYALNKMLFSFCTEEARNEFDADQAAYCDKFGVSGKYKEAVLTQDFLGMLKMGGNIYFIAKMCIPRGTSVQDCGAAFQGITTKEFQAKLLQKGEGLVENSSNVEITGMAKIIGGVTSSHIPAVGNAIANNLTQEPYWKRFFDGYGPAKEWLQKHKPDIAIVVYNDHGLNFFLDKQPTFALGCADVYPNADEGWGLKPVASFQGDAQLSWHIAESLVEQEFDITMCQEMLVDHGFVNPIRALYGTHDVWPIKAIPLAVNTVQHPVPTAKRCLALGRALRKAVESYPEDLKVVIMGTGGMSHQLQGERAGLINVEFDLETMDKIATDPEWMTQFSNAEIMRMAGTEGIETIMWLVMRGALQDDAKVIHKHYHAPISNTGAGVLVLENY